MSIALNRTNRKRKSGIIKSIISRINNCQLFSAPIMRETVRITMSKIKYCKRSSRRSKRARNNLRRS